MAQLRKSQDINEKGITTEKQPSPAATAWMRNFVHSSGWPWRMS
jgi:hypothetical protein